MAKLYTEDRIQEILTLLEIQPVKGALTTREVAQVLTWRAKEEQGQDYTYTESSVRARVASNSLIPVGGKRPNSRKNTYLVQDAFMLPLVPTRGMGQPRKEEKP